MLTKYDLMFIDFLTKCPSFTCFFPPQYFFMLSVSTLSLCWTAGPLMAKVPRCAHS